jgi:hypothetical protein
MKVEVHRNELLYDKEYLNDLRDRLDENGVPPNPVNIKRHTDTDAFIYEIRTALRFWFGGRASHRTSDRVWNTCKAIGDGVWKLNDDSEVVYA